MSSGAALTIPCNLLTSASAIRSISALTQQQHVQLAHLAKLRSWREHGQ